MLKNLNNQSKKYFKNLDKSSITGQIYKLNIKKFGILNQGHKNVERKQTNINEQNEEPKDEKNNVYGYKHFLLYGALFSGAALLKKGFEGTDDNAYQKEKPTLDENTWVCVRVWWPTTTQGEVTTSKESVKGGGNVGHVSLETSTGEYRSFWPTKPPTREDGIKGALKYPRPSQNLTLEEDKAAEGWPGPPKEPDVVLYFYSLDMKLLENEWKKIAKENTAYVLKGNIVYNYFVGENCSSFVYRLLKAGNIEQLNSSLGLNWKLTTPTPDVIGNFVIKAKNAELALYPETKEWDNNLNSEEEKGCTIF